MSGNYCASVLAVLSPTSAGAVITQFLLQAIFPVRLGLCTLLKQSRERFFVLANLGPQFTVAFQINRFAVHDILLHSNGLVDTCEETLKFPHGLGTHAAFAGDHEALPVFLTVTQQLLELGLAVTQRRVPVPAERLTMRFKCRWPAG